MGWTIDQIVEIGKKYNIDEKELKEAVHCLGQQTVARCLKLGVPEEHRPKGILAKSKVRFELIQKRKLQERTTWKEAIACVWLNPTWIWPDRKEPVDLLFVVDGPNEDGALLGKHSMATCKVVGRVERLLRFDSGVESFAYRTKLTVGGLKEITAYAIRHYLDLADTEELIILSHLPVLDNGKIVVSSLDPKTRRRLVRHKIGALDGKETEIALQGDGHVQEIAT